MKILRNKRTNEYKLICDNQEFVLSYEEFKKLSKIASREVKKRDNKGSLFNESV